MSLAGSREREGARRIPVGGSLQRDPQVSGAGAQGPGGGSEGSLSLQSAAEPQQHRPSRGRGALPGPERAGTCRGRGAGEGTGVSLAERCLPLAVPPPAPVQQRGARRCPVPTPGCPGGPASPPASASPPGSPAGSSFSSLPALLSPRTPEHQLLFLLVTALLVLPTSTGDQSIVAVLGTDLGSNCFYGINELCLE